MLRRLLFLIMLNTSCYANTTDFPISWVELGEEGAVIARAITDQTECPLIRMDDTSKKMQLRVAATPPKFPVTVCETLIPAIVKYASISGHALPLPSNDIQRIAVIGDTGCRVNFSFKHQGCGDPKQWPFKRVANAAVQFKPNVVVHVGDYLYREIPCLFNHACFGSPYGDTWATWDADFFEPARALLNAAPWIVVRGNHESCKRGGQGWFRFLDPRPYSETCQDSSAPYHVPLGHANLFILDTSHISDKSAPANQVAQLAKDLDAINKKIISDKTSHNWIVTHKPFWFLIGVAEGKNKLENIRNTFHVVAKDHLSPKVDLILAGHIHRFEEMNFSNGYPAEVIAGNSGSRLDDDFVPAFLDRLSVGGSIIHQGVSSGQGGYFALSYSDKGWRGELHDVDNRTVLKLSPVILKSTTK